MQKISFNDRYGLTKAVLNGTKTMTRRLEKGLENLEEGNFCYSKHNNGILLYGEKGSVIETIKTRYKLGEVVAVAQSYKDLGYTKEWVERHISPNPNAKWNDPFEKIYPGWINKMFVPAELNKAHQIQITGVRIERLQAISDDDCLKEGIKKSMWMDISGKQLYGFGTNEDKWTSPRETFAALINRPGVGRKGLWESNPWFICYSFKLVK